MSDLRTALDALAKRHEWTPGMGPCVCEEHEEARRLLAATPPAPSEPTGTLVIERTAWSHRVEPDDHHAPTMGVFGWPPKCGKCAADIAGAAVHFGLRERSDGGAG